MKVGRRKLKFTFFSAMLLIGSFLSEKAFCADRIALVIANSAYRSAPPLSNPANDGQDVAQALSAIGFDVIFVVDADKRDMEKAIVKFSRRAADAEAALFYYAGHGLQFQGHNYLIPIDAQLEDQFSLRYEATDFDEIKAALSGSKAIKMLILDACRNNPMAARLARSMGTNSRSADIVRGLAQMEKTSGMLVVYATQSNEIAEDGAGRNSPFSQAFLDQVKIAGLDTSDLFRRISREVYASTQGRQEPEISISNFPDYIFNKSDTDRTVWMKIGNTADPAMISDFLARYPESVYAAEAKLRLELIQRQAVEHAQAEELVKQKQKLEEAFANTERERSEKDRIRALEQAREKELLAKVEEVEANRIQIVKKLSELQQEQIAKASWEKEQDAVARQAREEAERARTEEGRKSAELQAAIDREQTLKNEILQLRLEASRAKDLQIALASSNAEASKRAEATQRQNELAAKLESAEADKLKIEAELARREGEKAAIVSADKEREKKIDAALDAAQEAKREKELKDQELRQASVREKQLEAEIETLQKGAAEARMQTRIRTDDTPSDVVVASKAGGDSVPLPAAIIGAVGPITTPGIGPLPATTSIQAELRRLGCYSGGDSDWDTPNMQQAFSRLARFVPTISRPKVPTSSLLEALKRVPDQVCIHVCGAGTMQRNGICIAIPAARLLRKVAMNAPVHRFSAKRLQVDIVTHAKPVRVNHLNLGDSAPSTGSKPCFSFKGKQFCE